MKLSVSKSPFLSSQASIDGAGKPDVVLIHGTGSSGQMWQTQVDFLNHLGHNCYNIDLRGHGSSVEPGDPADLVVHAADIVETLNDIGLDGPVVFVGHSLGAIISVSLAESHAHLVKAVFAAGLPGRVLKPMSLVFRMFMGTGYDAIKKSGVHEKWAFRPRTLINTERHALEQILQNFESVDLLSSPPKLSCPLHLAAGRFDPVAPCHYAIRLHKVLPDSTLTIFEMAGHNFMDMYPEKFNQWLNAGLEKL